MYEKMKGQAVALSGVCLSSLGFNSIGCDTPQEIAVPDRIAIVEEIDNETIPVVLVKEPVPTIEDEDTKVDVLVDSPFGQIHFTAPSLPEFSMPEIGFSKVTESIQGYTTTATENSQILAERAWAQVNDTIHSPFIAENVNNAVLNFGKQLDRLADDPTTGSDGKKIGTNLLINRVPGLAHANKYADARALYHYCHSEACPEERRDTLEQEAKRKCLYACMRLGMDVTLLGLPNALDLPVEIAEHFVDVAHYSQLASDIASKSGYTSVPFMNINPDNFAVLNPFLDKALENERVSEAMTSLLLHDFNANIIDIETP